LGGRSWLGAFETPLLEGEVGFCFRGVIRKQGREKYENIS